MRIKRISVIVLALLLLLSMCTAALATDESQSFEFILSADKSGTLKTGDEFTVNCTLKRTDKSENWQMYGWQTEIAFDNTAFELVDGSVAPADGVGGSLQEGEKENKVFFNDYSLFASGDAYPTELMAGTFTLRVTGNVSGSYAVRNTNYLVSTQGGADVYKTGASDLTITLQGSPAQPSGGGTGGGTGGGGASGGGGAVVIAPAPTPAQTTDFSDVPAGAWYEDAVKYVTEKGLFNGTGENEFSPGASMTRAMVMTVLARMDGADTSRGETWYEKGMAWAVDNGVSDGTNPESEVTREQLATMLYRFAASRGYKTGSADLSKYTDADSVSTWAKNAMAWAVETGLINGRTDTTLVPNGTANRAEVATIFMRFCENIIGG